MKIDEKGNHDLNEHRNKRFKIESKEDNHLKSFASTNLISFNNLASSTNLTSNLTSNSSNSLTSSLTNNLSNNNLISNTLRTYPIT